MRFKRSGVTEDILLTRSNIGNISNVNRNGTNTVRGYNTAHGLTTLTGGTTQTYDTDGNTTTLHTNVSAVWDDAGRMKNTNVPAGATAGIQGLNENGYVGGNRIWKKITRSGSVVEHRVHIHAGPNLIAEYNAGVAASTPVQEYVYAGEIDSLVLIRRSDATKYGVTRNRQWSIIALHDLANGSVVERYAYEMTGKRSIYAANGTTVRTTSTYGNPFGYTNRSHDEDSGLMYFRARYYNPLTGEFLSRDPMEFVDGMSLYRGYFVINSTDPGGYMRMPQDGTAFPGHGIGKWDDQVKELVKCENELEEGFDKTIEEKKKKPCPGANDWNWEYGPFKESMTAEHCCTEFGPITGIFNVTTGYTVPLPKGSITIREKETVVWIDVIIEICPKYIFKGIRYLCCAKGRGMGGTTHHVPGLIPGQTIPNVHDTDDGGKPKAYQRYLSWTAAGYEYRFVSGTIKYKGAEHTVGGVGPVSW